MREGDRQEKARTGCSFHPRSDKYAATPDERCSTRLPILDAVSQASRHESTWQLERN